MEDEYIAATEASKELIWINRLLQDFSIPRLLTDHNHTKHIDIRYHFIRSEVAAGTLILQSIGIKENIADILTKAVPKATFEMHRAGMGISIFSHEEQPNFFCTILAVEPHLQEFPNSVSIMALIALRTFGASTAR